MKKTVLLVTTIISFFFNAYGMNNQSEYSICEATKIQYKKNNFGDIFPQWQEIPYNQLSEQLSYFVNYHKDKTKETPFIIEIPHIKAWAIESIQKAGFTFFHADNDKSEWIFKNNSSIPDPYTASIGSGICVRKNDTLLVVEEKSRPGILGLPGGTTDKQELLRTTAMRELKEELNLDIDLNDLTLFALINRINTNRFHANGVDHYYVIDHTKVRGKPKPNSSEIIQVFYASLHDISAGIPVNNLVIDTPLIALANHLFRKSNRSYHMDLLDYRQLSGKNAQLNQNNIMILEFFAQ